MLLLTRTLQTKRVLVVTLRNANICVKACWRLGEKQKSRQSWALDAEDP